MAKTNISDYRFSIFINNDQAKRSLVEMENVMRGYEAELQKLVNENKRDSAEYREKKKILDEHKAKMVELRKEAGLQALSLKELKALRASLYNEMARAIPGTEHRKKLETEFNAVNQRINQVTVGAKTAGMTLGKLADSFNRYFGMITAGIAAFAGFAFSIKTLITKNAELDDSLANIRKTTGMTMLEVQKLNSQLGKINTRTGRSELREIAVVAGQLGIAKQDIFAFTESVDKLNVALGDEFKGGAEEVATEMGKLRNVLTDMKSGNVADDMLRIGNAVNELGAAGFATGPVVADFASRIGGVGISLGLTSDEVLGLSATLQELNVNTERGGTGVIRILQKMTQNTDTFAKVAGMSVKDFEQLVNTDLYGAFIKVIEGSRRSGQSATALSGIIKELEVSGIGASEIFAKLGSNTGLLAEKVALAGKSLQGTDSIMAEFNIKNATLGAVIAKLQKDFYSLVTMPGVTNFFKNQVYHVVELVNWLKDLPLILEKYRILLIAVSGATLAWIAAKTKSIQVGILHNLMLKEGIGLRLKDQIVMTVLIAKEELLTIWKGKGTVATKLATTAQYAWNAALKANPIGLVIIALTALIAAVKAYEKYNSEAVRLEQLKESTGKRLNTVNSVLANNYTKLNDQIRDLNKLSVQEKIDLQDKIDKNIKLAESELLVMEARQKKIQADNSKPTVWQRAVNYVSAGGNPLLAESDNIADGLENGRKAAEKFDESLKTLRDNLKSLKDQGREFGNIMNAEAIGNAIMGKSQGELEEKLRNYQIALKDTVAGSEKYLRIQQKIKDVNKELSKFSLDPGGDGSVSSKLKELNNLLKEHIELLEQQVTEDPEQAKITARKIADYKNQIQVIEELIKKLQEEANLERQIEELRKTPFTKLSSIKSPGLETSSNAPLPEPGTATGVYNESWDDQSEVGKPTETQIWAKKANQFITGYVEPVLNGLMSIDQAMAAYENAQLAKDERANEEKKKNLKRQLDGKIISQKQYDAEVAKLDQEMDAKKRKLQHDQAVRNKEISLVQAIINTAQAVTAALTLPVAGVALAVIAGLLGAIQIGLILATPVPEAATGRYKAIQRAKQAAMGSYDVIGQSDGKYYPGVPYDPKFGTGIPGRPLLVNETGNEIVIDPDTTKNLIMNYPEVIKAINMARVPQRASGAYVDPSGTSTGKEFPREITLKSETDPRLLEILDRLDQRMSEPMPAVVDWDHFEEQQAKIDSVRKFATR